jgi:hypothetical protein
MENIRDQRGSLSVKKLVRSQSPAEIKGYRYPYRMITEKAKEENSAMIFRQEEPMKEK